MSSSSPPGAVENDEMKKTPDEEAPRPGHAAESAGTEVEAGAAANHTVSSPHELNDGPDAYDDDSGDEYDEDDMASDDDDDMDDDFGDVDDDYLDDEAGKFSKSAEVEATVEALWRKVVAAEEKPSAGNTCSVCMEHLTCEGPHRICCIPCGHVYGRSCLERWLRRDGNETARCPQCCVMFADNHIIDLYAPGNLWEGCGRVQEVKAYVSEAVTEVLVQCEKQIVKLKAEQRSCDQLYAKVRELQDLMVQTEKERREQQESLKKAITEMNYLNEKNCAKLKLVEEHITAAKLTLSRAKQAELQEEGPPVQYSRARRIIKPNKRFCSNEWTR